MAALSNSVNSVFVAALLILSSTVFTIPQNGPPEPPPATTAASPASTLPWWLVPQPAPLILEAAKNETKNETEILLTNATAKEPLNVTVAPLPPVKGVTADTFQAEFMNLISILGGEMDKMGQQLAPVIDNIKNIVMKEVNSAMFMEQPNEGGGAKPNATLPLHPLANVTNMTELLNMTELAMVNMTNMAEAHMNMTLMSAPVMNMTEERHLNVSAVVKPESGLPPEAGPPAGAPAGGAPLTVGAAEAGPPPVAPAGGALPAAVPPGAEPPAGTPAPGGPLPPPPVTPLSPPPG